MRSALYSGTSQDQKGATMVEYGLIIALVSLAVIGTVTAIGNQIDTNFQVICKTLNHSEACD